jgi:hypothetical protein
VDHFIHDTEANTSSHVIAAYIDAQSEPNDLVVDPFCRSPAVITTALQLGRRVIATNLNPLQALQTRLALTLVPASDLGASLTRLGDSPKLDSPLREHLLRLYRTHCRRCAEEVIASYFVWERGHDVPAQVSYHCAACGETDLAECNESDFQVLRSIQPRGLHYWYVLDRVARKQDEEAREFATQLLELYTTRNLYILSNLVLRVQDLLPDSLIFDLMRLALLQCLKRGSKLNAVPGDPPVLRPGRLQPPARFAEHNVWTLFVEAVSELQRRQPAWPVTFAAEAAHVVAPPLIDAAQEPAEPPRAFAGHMPVRKLCAELAPKSVGCIVAQPPRPGRGRWALDYLWSGWLFGHEASAPLWPLVRRRSSDWNWYLRAMQATLSALRDTLQADGKITFIGRDKPLGYCESLLFAAAAAELRLEIALYQPAGGERATKPFSGQRGEYRLTWTVGAPPPPWPMELEELWDRVEDTALDAALDTLAQRAEPAAFARLHCSIWKGLAQQGLAQRLMAVKDLPSPLTVARQRIRGALQAGLSDQLRLLAWDESEDTSMWWLAHPLDARPLAERIEQSAYEVLQSAEAAELGELLSELYACFPDALTPDREWAVACLKSYAQQTPSGLWMLRDTEAAEHRQQVCNRLVGQLEALGRRLGFEASIRDPQLDLLWTEDGTPIVGWVVLDSAALSRLPGSVSRTAPAMHWIAVLFETRQDLLCLRVSRAPWLREQLASTAWRFVTDRDIGEWGSREEITAADLDALTGGDPLSLLERSQLTLI